MKLRIASLPPPRGAQSYVVAISSAPTTPTLVVPQLTAVRTSINSCLDAIDVVSWGGDATNASFVAGQLQLLQFCEGQTIPEVGETPPRLAADGQPAPKANRNNPAAKKFQKERAREQRRAAHKKK